MLAVRVEFERPVVDADTLLDEPEAEPDVVAVEVGARDPVVEELNEALEDASGAEAAQFRTSKATVPRMVMKWETSYGCAPG